MITRLKFYFIAVFLLVTTGLFAQVTTSSINGKVVADGGAVVGATVQAVHIPSGTKYGAYTNEKGRYAIQGMRVGGPYKITISFVGYQTEEINNVQLGLGDASTFNVDLKESATQLGEVTVVGTGKDNAGGGAASSFNQSQIENTPTVNRNIYDIAKMSPLVSASKIGGLSIAGSNNRYNSFQIDGMVSNDVFGLASSGTNGGQTGANPISLDAIQEIQVVVSPFDVTQGNFTGGAINAVTKSGTNKFKGSAYGYYSNQDFYGTWNQVKDTISKLGEQSTKTVGFTLGGPIIKDKLFFFTNAEYKYNTYPSTYYPGYSSTYITADQAQQILDRYTQITGYSDNYNQRNIGQQGLSALARLDWNINNNNKFSFRYQYNNSYQDVYGSGSTSYYFANSAYRITDVTNSIVAELNSHFGSSLYNEARLGATYVRDNRDVPYQGPNVSIGGLGSGGVTAYIGTEYSSGANKLNQDIYTFEDNLSWYLGDHTLTFGTHDEIYNMYNLFIQASNGSYSYTSLANFLADKASSFVYKYSDPTLTGSYQWAATVKAGQFGLYAQDKWDISKNLNLTYGLRIDVPMFFNAPSTNTDFNASTYATTYGVATGVVPSAKIMWSPRVGFKYYTDDSHKTLIRGGAGLFTGRVPFVWMSNNWSNTGVEMKGTTIKTSVPSFETYWNDPQGAMASATGTASKPDINTVSKDFKYPQVLRGDLALEQTLPYDIKMTLEGLYSKTLNNVWFENLALTDAGNKVYAVSADDANSANTYWTTSAGSYNSIVNLKNTNAGYTYALSAKLEKNFDFGLNLMASYTFGHSYSVNDGTSSVAYSNWKYNYCVNPNVQALSYSTFDIPNKVFASVSYTSPKYAKGLLSTTVALNYNGYNGMRYSLTTYEASTSYDSNGDGYAGNSLLYIPTTNELVKMTFATETDRTSFETWIEGDKYASTHRGQYATRNSNSAPWENHFDFHLAEDILYNKTGGKVSLLFDILNVGNLINHNWGTNYSSAYNVTPLKVTALTKTTSGGITTIVPTYSYLGYGPTKSDFYSRWNAQIGLKVTF